MPPCRVAGRRVSPGWSRASHRIVAVCMCPALVPQLPPLLVARPTCDKEEARGAATSLASDNRHGRASVIAAPGFRESPEACDSALKLGATEAEWPLSEVQRWEAARP